MSQRRREAGPPERLLEQLSGRGTDALTNFFANLGIVLRHLQNRVVFLHREALIGNGLCQDIDGLIRNPLLVGGRRGGYSLLIILLETGHPLYGGCRRVPRYSASARRDREAIGPERLLRGRGELPRQAAG
jgi:hypothetical protein